MGLLALGQDDFQIISYHDKGQKAFLANGKSPGLDENSREVIESQLSEKFGDEVLARTFHFIE